MKLLDKYNRLNIAATIITFVVGSCIFYFVLNYILIRELDETLQTEQQEIISFAQTHNALPEIIPTQDQHIQYELIAVDDAIMEVPYKTIKKKLGKTEENYRELQFTIKAGKANYIVTVDKPIEETEDLLKVIIAVTIAMIGIILLIGFLINRIVITRLWKPFYETISRVKNYHLTDQDSVKLEQQEIDEFSLLNTSINEMVDRIQQDYGSLKNFTGQAAHEMQTPLAVIRTKLDSLIQNEEVLQKNATDIADIERAVHRLSRLHQSLLLLTRVENRQYVLNGQVALDKVITEKYGEYAEMAEAMKLSYHGNLQSVSLLFHQQLAEIVISNLLNNAIRYNKQGGSIEIILKSESLSITNTSDNGVLDNTRLFKRFYRDTTTIDGTGLGLSIVKQICDLAGFAIRYNFSDGRHTFIIQFS